MAPVASANLPAAPVLCGISGLTMTMLNMVSRVKFLIMNYKVKWSLLRFFLHICIF